MSKPKLTTTKTATNKDAYDLVSMGNRVDRPRDDDDDNDDGGNVGAPILATDVVVVEGKTDTGHKYHGYSTLISVAFAFLLVFIGYQGTEALQTHINTESGLGMTTIAIVYGCFYLSCFGFGPVIIGKFGSKWPVIIAWIAYASFIGANFYPRTWTLYPTAAMIGFAGGPVWISMGVYTTSLALEHASLNKKRREEVLSFFNGIFIGIFFFQYPISAFISSMIFIAADLYSSGDKPLASGILNYTSTVNQHVLKPLKLLSSSNDTSVLYSFTNVTTTAVPKYGAVQTVCGARYCAYISSHVAEIQQPEPGFIYINLGIFIGCVVLGMVLLAFQRPITPADHRPMSMKTRMKRLIQVLKHWKWLLLAPSFAVSGFMQGMALNTFSQAFVNCTLNIRWVNYVLTLRGLTCMTASFISGKLATYIPQWVLLMVAYLTELGVLVVWLVWTPTPELAWVFFIVQGVEGIGAGSLRVHATALLGYMFQADQEVAFAHLNMVIALATCFIMAIANFLCFGAQTWISIGMLLFAMVCFVILEIWLRRERNEMTDVAETRSSKSDRKKENNNNKDGIKLTDKKD